MLLKMTKVKQNTITALLILTLVAGLILTMGGLRPEPVSAEDGDKAAPASPPISEEKKEERGLWIAFSDFTALGLTNASEEDFASGIERVLDKAVYYGITSIYFHVRSHDDAAWMSKTFKPNKYLSPTGKATGKAANAYDYDPLEIVVRETHARGMKLHAWMNPYRITPEYYLDPSKQATTDRICTAVKEILAYDVDGIHMDDYFYSASKGYTTVGSSKKYKVSIGAAKKRSNCSKMVKAVYDVVHTKSDVVFGISPSGNYENCMNMGADVKKWLSASGYVDYLAPQIYWTDNWGRTGKEKLYTNRMNLFKKLNKQGLPMYIGLAFYRTGYKQSDDKGWGKRNTNIRDQIIKLRKAGMQGFILFCSQDLFDANSAKERRYLKNLIKPALAKQKAAVKIIVIDAGHQTKADTRPEPVGPGASAKSIKVSGGTTRSIYRSRKN